MMFCRGSSRGGGFFFVRSLSYPSVWSDVSAQRSGSAIAVFCVWSLVVKRGSPLLYSSSSSCDEEGSLRVTYVAAGPSCHSVFG